MSRRFRQAALLHSDIAGDSLRVVRVYHAGRDPGHRRREAALAAAGAEVTLVVPTQWPDHGSEDRLAESRFEVRELRVDRVGDVNRHRYADPDQIRRLLDDLRPDLLDLHEEPFSVAARQWLAAVRGLPVVMYTAQNLDKRFPPPFAQFEASALRSIHGMYPCSRQAASVVRGKGFLGPVAVLPLGFEPHPGPPGIRRTDDFSPLRLAIVGRLVAEKGIRDAVAVLAAVSRHRAARLTVAGDGPELAAALELAAQLGVRDWVEVRQWSSADQLAEVYAESHIVLVPSRRTATWVEQFGRVIVEAQAAGAVVAGYASGAIPEVMGDSGIVTAEGDVEGLARAILGLVADQQEFLLASSAGVQRSRRCSWERVAAEQVQLYERVLAEASPNVAGGRFARVKPREQRARARTEFGPVASTTAGERPFAVPVLRNPSTLSRSLANVIDRFTGG